jgi:hypothetical protein
LGDVMDIMEIKEIVETFIYEEGKIYRGHIAFGCGNVIILYIVGAYPEEYYGKQLELKNGVWYSWGVKIQLGDPIKSEQSYGCVSFTCYFLNKKELYSFIEESCNIYEAQLNKELHISENRYSDFIIYNGVIREYLEEMEKNN